MGQLTADDVRRICREEQSAETARLERRLDDIMEASVEAQKNTGKALERLSIVVVGEPTMRINGLLHDVDELKKAHQISLLERAKLSGVWAVALVVGGGVLKVLWHFIEKALE